MLKDTRLIPLSARSALAIEISGPVSLESVIGFKEEQVKFSSYIMIVRSRREGGS